MSSTTGIPCEWKKNWRASAPRFVTRDQIVEVFAGRRVAIVGSGPGCLDNEPGFVDAHDVVVRVNNYKTGPAQGFRTDVFFSYFGNAIKKTPAELLGDGVFLCMSKVPDAQAIRSRWHERNGKTNGVDFRWIYAMRAGWWPGPVYVPTLDRFLAQFEALGRRMPTTGFSAIVEIASLHPASIYLTGFDFFTSGVHNVDERWRRMNPGDPIAHAPEVERAWLQQHRASHPFKFDKRLQGMIK